MRAKLVKQELGYILFDEKGIPIGTTPNVLNNNTFSKLSLKNCQVIERGYDLDELWKETIFSESISINSDIGESFKAGFQKALEILGDQRFTDKDLDKAIEYGHESRMPFNEDWYNEFIQSLQQNEWEVEVEMEKYDFDEEWSEIGGAYETFKLRPKLDADGCIILKRV